MIKINCKTLKHNLYSKLQNLGANNIKLEDIKIKKAKNNTYSIDIFNFQVQHHIDCRLIEENKKFLKLEMIYTTNNKKLVDTELITKEELYFLKIDFEEMLAHLLLLFLSTIIKRKEK